MSLLSKKRWIHAEPGRCGGIGLAVAEEVLSRTTLADLVRAQRAVSGKSKTG